MTNRTPVTPSPSQENPQGAGEPRVIHAQETAGPLGDSTPQFLTAAEVAVLMRVSKMTVYRLVHSGELTSIRVGHSFRIPATSFTAYLASNVTVPGQPAP